MDAVPVELDRLFERARRAKDLVGWTPVHIPEAQSMDLSLTRLELSQDVALLCAQYEVNLPLSHVHMLGQPEVYFNPHRQSSDVFESCNIEELIAPGDAIAWVQLKLTPLMQRTTSLIGTPQKGTLNFESCRLRAILRRDFPQPGSITIVVAPLHPETHELLEELGFLKATVAIAEPHEEPGKTRCTEVKQLTRVPSWALPMAAAPHFRHQLDSCVDYAGSDAFKEVIEGGGLYIIVGMRRCVKGPPLLPRDEWKMENGEIEEWVEAESGGVRVGLPEYLQTFLQRLGFTGVQIFDQLHGRQVVRYQAVVQRRAWDQAWAMLENPFRAQRAAYRRLHGGTNAPALTFDMEPKFLACDEADAPKFIAHGYDTSICVPTARTFIHFSETTTRPRLGSEPAYIDIDYYDASKAPT